jgi:hypothetical protein
MNQIKEKENIYDKLEEEIVYLRKDLDKSKTQIKFMKGSETLDNILINQRSLDNKTELGYKESIKIVKGESSTSMSTNEKPTSYANDLKGNNNQCNKSKDDKKKQSELDHPNYAKKYEARKQQVPESYQAGRQRMIPTSKFFIPRHPNFFYGYYLSCGNFGHKVVSCRTFRHNRNIGMRFNKPQMDMYQNSLSPLLNGFECYICNNFGHKENECRSKMFPIYKKDRQEDFTKVWRKKNKNKENCGLTLYAKNQENQGYIDSGCSKHMTGDNSKFEFLTKEKGSIVAFGNNAPSRIRGKGNGVLDKDKKGKTKEKNVLYVDGLKHNLLSVSPMCEQGHIVLFHSKGCEVMDVNTRNIVLKEIKTSGNVYVLEEGKEKCCIGKTDES